MPRREALPIPELSDRDVLRFWVKVDKSGDCWTWLASINDNGYGVFSIGGKRGHNYRAHRVSYALTHGDIRGDLTLDHLCRNRACVNPAHLEPVTDAENIRRGVATEVLVARIRGKTHCPQGHAYDERNTYWTPEGWRNCRACHRDREIQRRLRRT